MPDVIIIGDGPGGLSAALFLAKNRMDVVVVGRDKTAMHWALVKNYLGLPEVLGSDFQAVARTQVAAVGGRILDDTVTTVGKVGDRYTADLESGTRLTARYLVLSEGKAPKLAKQLGLEFDDNKGIETDKNSCTAIGVYVVGRSARPGRSQAIISAGDGAAAAIDILSRDKGENFIDWDEPPKASGA